VAETGSLIATTIVKAAKKKAVEDKFKPASVIVEEVKIVMQ
jgi:hypothetical protein